MKVEWDNPTLQFVQQGNTSYNPHQSIIELSGAANSVRFPSPLSPLSRLSLSPLSLTKQTQWTFWIIVNAAPIPHPIHLHGHDFHTLGQKAHCNFTDKSELNFANPLRRDVAMLPAAGYLVIGFVLDNPGAWLLHCHIVSPRISYPILYLFCFLKWKWK
jgi:FtsP/CotA-like multicopper oxidase with cupredoxin domain